MMKPNTNWNITLMDKIVGTLLLMNKKPHLEVKLTKELIWKILNIHFEQLKTPEAN